MKTRIIHTKFYDDSYIASLSTSERFLFLYFFTNENVNIIHCYEIPERKIIFQTGIDAKTIQKAKQKFHADNKIYFNGDFVYLKNAGRYENYTGDKNEKAKEREKNQLPPEIQDWVFAINNDTPMIPVSYPLDTPISENKKDGFEAQTDRGIDRGIHTPLIPPINHKSEIINNNSLEGGVGETFLEAWNTAMGTKYKSTKAFISNLQEWLKTYSMEEIVQAVKIVPQHHFWKDKMAPDVFLRQRNPSGENVDRIGEMLNYKPSKAFEGENKDKYNDL